MIATTHNTILSIVIIIISFIGAGKCVYVPIGVYNVSTRRGRVLGGALRKWVWLSMVRSINTQTVDDLRADESSLVLVNICFVFKSVPLGGGPRLEVLQYQGNPWDGRSKLHSSSRIAKIELIAWGHCPR